MIVSRRLVWDSFHGWIPVTRRAAMDRELSALGRYIPGSQPALLIPIHNPNLKVLTLFELCICWKADRLIVSHFPQLNGGLCLFNSLSILPSLRRDEARLDNSLDALPQR